MTEKRITIFASSASSTSVSADKSNFVYTFNPPLQIPKDKNPHIELIGAEIYWNVPNINLGVNNTMEITMTNVNGGSPNVFTLETGLYSLSAINQAMQTFLHSLNVSSDSIELIGQSATSKILAHCRCTSQTGNISINWSNSTLSTLLGFNSAATFTALLSNGESSTLAPNIAVFNTFRHYCIEARGLNIGSHLYNEVGRNKPVIAAIIPADVSVGERIIYEPINPLVIPCEISGQTISHCTFALTDAEHRLQTTSGEDWSLRCVISY